MQTTFRKIGSDMTMSKHNSSFIDCQAKSDLFIIITFPSLGQGRFQFLGSDIIIHRPTQQLTYWIPFIFVKQMSKFDMDEVEDLLDDMVDMMADQEDIQEMMSRTFGVEYDESELLDELNELDEEIIGDQLNEEGLGLPSYIPPNN